MIYQHKEGVNFKKASLSDLSLLTDMKNESWWGTHKSLIVNEDDQRKWFENLTDTSLFMIGYHENEVFGVATYTNIDYVTRSLDISGIALKSARTKSPYVSFAGFKAGVDFAFEILNMNRLNAEVLETNLAALKIDTSILGFQCEGRKRQAAYKCGQYYDSIMLGLLREDWGKQSRIVSYKGSCNLNFDVEIAQRSAVIADKLTLNSILPLAITHSLRLSKCPKY